MIARPCITCGTVIKAGTRCDDCRRTTDRRRIRTHSPKASPKARGYDSQWKRLSKQARQLQPWCEICGTKQDLQADHLPIAWERHDKGLPIRLQDVRVLCGKHNREAGAARGSQARRSVERTPQALGDQQAEKVRQTANERPWGASPAGHSPDPARR